MKNYNAIEGMITESQSILQNRLYVAYDRGYEQGLKDNSEEAYQNGLDDAWECAKKICSKEGLTLDEINTIFKHRHVGEVFTTYSASEAIAKIKSYEEQKKAEEEEIKVGDEVIGKFGFFRGVVVGIDLQSQKASVLNVGYQLPQTYSLNCIDRTTGRHFSQILEVLEQLEGE